MAKYKYGDKLIYHKPKHSSNPSLNAKDLKPSEHGEEYDYTIKKYWIFLQEVDGYCTCLTPTFKLNYIKVTDVHLRKANIFEQIFFKRRFPDFNKYLNDDGV